MTYKRQVLLLYWGGLFLILFSFGIFILHKYDQKILSNFELRGLSETEKAIARACYWITQQQKMDGSIFIPGEVVDHNIWETAHAVTALQHCSSRFVDEDVVPRALQFLSMYTLKTGGLPESTRRFYSPYRSHGIETTSTVLHVYNAAGETKQAKIIQKFLLSQQDSDGGWKIGYPEANAYDDTLERFPVVAGFALRAITSLEVDATDMEAVNRAFEWVSNRQHLDGDWGAFPDYLGTPYYATAFIIPAYVQWMGPEHDVVERAVQFTLDRQNGDGSWGQERLHEKDDMSKPLWTALAVLTLEHSQQKTQEINEAIRKGVRYLITSQTRLGFWDGGYFNSDVVNNDNMNKKADLYTTIFALQALQKYISH